MTEIINNEISIGIPDGFHVMSEEELTKVYVTKDPKRWGIWDNDRHVIISVLWQDLNAFTAMLADIDAAAVRNEQLTKKGYEGHDYAMKGFHDADISGSHARGYSFTYRIQDISQRVDTLLFKAGRRIYSINCIGRNENREQDHELFKEILKTVSILK
ncbi:MAG: hypothetical protein IJI75_00650 [Solobacterium sp.]|nr:hypothetical protein [Solobacterium sp.]